MVDEKMANVIDLAAARAVLRPSKPVSFVASLNATLQNIDDVFNRYRARIGAEANTDG
jgi:hypothetical protein